MLPEAIFASFSLVLRDFAILLSLCCAAAGAAEIQIDYSQTPEGKTPAGFTNLLAGSGEPGNWRVMMDDVPPLMAPLTAQAPTVIA